MARWQWSLPLALVGCVLAATPLAAQPPDRSATPTERLDYLLSQWRGQTVAHVREVWGREKETELRGQRPVLVYERQIKVRPGFGQVMVQTGDARLRCVVRFEIDDAEKVARTSRQGGGQQCWNVWRRYEP
jgi:hypothetical protein